MGHSSTVGQENLKTKYFILSLKIAEMHEGVILLFYLGSIPMGKNCNLATWFLFQGVSLTRHIVKKDNGFKL